MPVEPEVQLIEPQPQPEVQLQDQLQPMEPEVQSMENQPHLMEQVQFMESQPQQMEHEVRFMESQPQQVEHAVKLMEGQPQPMEAAVQFMEGQHQPMTPAVQFTEGQPQQMEPAVQLMEDQPRSMEPEVQFVEGQPQQMEAAVQFMEGQPQPMEPAVQFMEAKPRPMDPEVQFVEGQPQPMEPAVQFMEDQPRPMEPEVQFMEGQPQPMEPAVQFLVEEQPQDMEPGEVQLMENQPQAIENEVQPMQDQPPPVDQLRDEVEPEIQLAEPRPPALQPAVLRPRPRATAPPLQMIIRVDAEFLRLLAILQSDSVSPESRDRNCATAVHFARRYGVYNVYHHLESRNHAWMDTPDCRCNQLFAEITRGCQETTTRYRILHVDMNMAAARLYESVDEESNRENSMHLLHIALRYRVDCAVFYLLARGVDVLSSCDVQVNCSALYHAIMADSLVYVQMTMVADMDRDRRYGNDWGTALHLAADRGFASCVVLLLREGFDPCARDDRLRTPLHLTARKNAFEIAKTLIRAGCDFELKDNQGYTALHVGAQKYRMCWLLLGEGADVNARTDADDTALLIAAGSVSPVAQRIVRLLVANGADIFARDNRGKSVLHRVRCKAVAECLVELGADLDATDDQGRTPLHVACDARRFDVVFALVEFGARADVMDRNGRYFDDDYRECAHQEPVSHELTRFCKFISRSMMFGVSLGQMYGPRAIGCCLLFRFNNQSRLELRKIEFKSLGTYTLWDICFRKLSDPGFVVHPEVRSFFEDENLQPSFPNYHTHLVRIYKMATWRNEIISDLKFLQIFSLIVLGRRGLSEEIARKILKDLSLSDLVSLKYAYNFR